MGLITPGMPQQRQYSELPKPPPDISTAVELFARKSGRTATVHFVPFGGWFVRLSLRPDDKRMQLWKAGDTDEPPSEDVWLHRTNPRYGQMVLGTSERESRFLPFTLTELGVAGVLEILDRGNTSTGRGEFDSVEDSVKSAHESNAQLKVRNKADAKEASRHESREKRRSIFKIPFLPGWGAGKKEVKQS